MTDKYNKENALSSLAAKRTPPTNLDEKLGEILPCIYDIGEDPDKIIAQIKQVFSEAGWKKSPTFDGYVKNLLPKDGSWTRVSFMAKLSDDEIKVQELNKGE